VCGGVGSNAAHLSDLYFVTMNDEGFIRQLHHKKPNGVVSWGKKNNRICLIAALRQALTFSNQIRHR